VERISGLCFSSPLLEEKRSAALERVAGMSKEEVARDFFRNDLLLDMVVWFVQKTLN